MVTRLGLSATARGPYGSFAGKTDASGVGALIMMLLMEHYSGGRIL